MEKQMETSGTKQPFISCRRREGKPWKEILCEQTMNFISVRCEESGEICNSHSAYLCQAQRCQKLRALLQHAAATKREKAKKTASSRLSYLPHAKNPVRRKDNQHGLLLRLAAAKKARGRGNKIARTHRTRSNSFRPCGTFHVCSRKAVSGAQRRKKQPAAPLEKENPPHSVNCAEDSFVSGIRVACGVIPQALRRVLRRRGAGATCSAAFLPSV